MFTLMRSIPVSQVLYKQLPSLATSIVIAELLYKFHSFTLECLAFLGTWLVIDGIIQSVDRFWYLLTKRSEPQQE